MAQAPPAVPYALYAHEFIVAEHGRAILPRHHNAGHPTGRLPQRGCVIAAIQAYIVEHNREPKPFIWTATASDILEKVKRGRQALYKVQSE